MATARRWFESFACTGSRILHESFPKILTSQRNSIDACLQDFVV